MTDSVENPELSNVHVLPVWKKGESAAEWFHEMSVLAQKYPERFKKVIICYEEELDSKATRNDYYCWNVNTTELVGILELAKHQCLRYVFKSVDR